jgi:hypothetical protein
LPAALAIGLSLGPVTDFDLGFHLRTGEWILQHGIPVTDPFSFTQEGKPWYLEQWLGATAFWLVFRAVGLVGLIVVKAAVVGAAFALAGAAAADAAKSAPLGALAAMLAAAAAQPRFNTQPFVFSFLFLASTAWMLGRARGRFWLVPLFALWPHVHVGWLYGAAFCGAWALGAAIEERSPRPLLLPLACGAAAAASLVALHPVGAGVLARVWHIYRSDFYRANIVELKPLGESYPLTAPLLFLFAVPPLVALFRPRKAALRWLLPQLLFAWSAARVGRLLSEASIAAAPALAASLATVLEEARGQTDRLARLARPPLAAAWLALAALAAIVLHLTQIPALDWQDESYPRACYRWLDAHEQGRGFNDMLYGGTFIFHFFPRRKVFIDGRTNYLEEFFRSSYFVIKNAEPGWKEEARRWDLRWFLLHPRRFARLHAALRGDPGFRLAHQEPNCAIYETVGP